MEKEFDTVIDELERFANLIYPESSRAAVIIGASQMDVELEKLIIKALRPSDEKDDELFANDRGLGTFSAKINMAYRLGLIDREFKHSLHIFRKIRNKFSHEVYGCNLNEKPYSNWLIHLTDYCKNDLEVDLTHGISLFPAQYKIDESTDSMKIAITFILGKLSALAYWVKPQWKDPWKEDHEN